MSSRSESESRAFTVVSANFGGAAREVALSDTVSVERPEALGAFIRDPSRTSRLETYPVIAGIQEVSKIGSPGIDRDAIKDLIGSHNADAQVYYAPTVSTAWYPLKAKWRARWNEQICDAEQGMAVCGIRGAALVDPECNVPKACGGHPPFRGVVLNLPVVKFRKHVAVEAEGEQAARPQNWISHTAAFGGAEPFPVEFRNTRYFGSRDTEPRIATAHRIRLGESDPLAEFIFINVHLTTLREEDTATVDPQGSDEGLRKTQRVPSREAEFLRHLQLSEICDFIWHVYTDASLQLPVIVAGDFNTTSDRPDLKGFMEAAFLKPVFMSDKCWSCGGAPLSQGRYFYSNERHKTVLTETPQMFEQITGDKAKSILTTECCSVCGKLLFTHKRNLKLIDNILYTNGRPPGTALKSTLELEESDGSVGIGADTYFSDHFPIWASFRLVWPEVT